VIFTAEKLFAGLSLASVKPKSARPSVRLPSSSSVMVLSAPDGASFTGATVIATAGVPEKQARVLGFGADVVLDYRDPEIVARARAVAADGVNVYWETQREPDFDRAVAILAEGGRMILMAGRDARPAFPVGPFYVKGCSLHGFAMFKASHAEQAAAAADINRWLAAGRLRAPIDRVLPLAQTAEAHALQESATVTRSGGLIGKIVIEP